MSEVRTVAYDDVFATLKEIFDDLAEDLGLNGTDITPDQGILSLGTESISIVYLVSELQQHYGLGNRVFDELRANDRLLKNMTVDDVITSVLCATK
jgi:acyl carrier protein